ncbi:ATP-binding protein [uncultured Microscilla sp.]|uniref:tetratricopeptide repeat-containing sensor histidine kinase n=1 Tax=uncultured Microscilla sp. TaxID=432653 RepID=UPI002623BFA4|nr:ATP-binding protein [uncultured Microscilla sp.]
MRSGWICFLCFWANLGVLLCSTTTNSFAQQNRSYRIVANQNALPTITADTAKVKVLNQLSEDTQYTNGVKALNYAREALVLAQKMKDTLAIARSQKNMGNAYYRLKNFNRAPVFLQQALSNYTKLNNKAGEADALNGLASVAIEDTPDKAPDYLKKALQTAQDANYSRGIMAAYQNEGDYYASQGDDKALQQYQKAVDTPLDSTGGLQQKGDIYRIMGDYQKKKQKYDEALKYYEQELKTRDKIGDKVALTETLQNIGRVYQQYKKNDEKALEYFFQAFVVAKDYNDQFDGQRMAGALEGIVDSYGTLAEDKQDQGKLKEAREYRKLYKAYKARLEAVKNNPKNTKIKTVYVPKYITKSAGNNNNNNPMPESQRVRLLEIEKRRLLVDNLVKSKRIGILEAAKKRAELINQEDSIRLLRKDKIISLLKKDTTDKAETITTLSQEKDEIEAEKNRRLWWLIGLAIVALLLVLFLLLRKRQIKKKAAKEIELHKNKSVNQINSQRREINEQKSALLRQTEELNTTKIQLEEVSKEKEGLNKILKEDIAPPTRTVVDLLKPDANENLNRAMVYQSGVQIMNLLDNVDQVQVADDATIILHKENHSIYKVSRSALDKVADLVTAQGIEVDNQIKPFFYAAFDYEIVERIFLNFFANALKYTPEGGKVSLNAQPVTREDKDVLEVTFRDNGVAVPEDKLHRVFDNFPPEVARPAGSSWAFNKKMIEAHGGKVEVLPADEGLHVTFTLLDAKSLEDVDYSDLLGVKDSSPEVVEIDIDSLEFTEEEKEIMRPFMEEFAQLEYYETSALKAVLNRIDPQGNSNLTKWKKALEQAILYLDEESYTKLTQL